MFVTRIKSPRCQNCEETMSLRIVEPERPGFDLRTFECPKCFVSETLVVPISGEADISIARSPVSPATPPPRSP
jgi:hypothetical protein